MILPEAPVPTFEEYVVARGREGLRVISTSAPGRCGIVGNPTDGYGGSVLSSSIGERARVELVHSDQFRLEVCGESEVLMAAEEPQAEPGFTRVARAVLSAYPAALSGRPFALRGTTDVPIEAGLSGSTAMLVAILGAVRRLLNVHGSPYEIAEEARRIEFDIMGVVCGFQDQYMTVFGGLRYLDFRDKQPGAEGDEVFATVESLEPFSAELPLVLANTGVRRHSGSVHGGLRERWISGDAAVMSGYHRIARLAREARGALLKRDWITLGAAMNENHAIQRDLGGSGEANERLIATALRAGAAGAKLAGAGKGGTIIALHEDPAYLKQRLREAGAERVFDVVPSEGLRVEGSL